MDVPNPYRPHLFAISATICQPDEYTASLIYSQLKPNALRTLFYAVLNLRVDESVELSPSVVAQIFQCHPNVVYRGTRELVKYNLLARRQGTVYWLSPRVARYTTITTNHQ